MRRLLLQFLLAVPLIHAQTLKLPLQPDSVKFAVIGDSGTGLKPQYQIAEEMLKYHGDFPFDFVIMMGDNIYGGQSQDLPQPGSRKLPDEENGWATARCRTAVMS